VHTCFTLGSRASPARRGCSGAAFAEKETERGRGCARFFLLAAEVGARGGCFYRLADSAGKYICSWRLRTLHAISFSSSHTILSLSLSLSLFLSLSPFGSLHGAPRRADYHTPIPLSFFLARSARSRTRRERRRAERERRDARGGATGSGRSRRDRGRECARHEGERVREPERLRGERSQLVIRSPPTDERAATERDRDSKNPRDFRDKREGDKYKKRGRGE